MSDISFLKLLVIEKAKQDPHASCFHDIIVKNRVKSSIGVKSGLDLSSPHDGETTPMEKFLQRNRMKNDYHEEGYVKILKNDKCSDIFKNLNLNKQSYEVISYKNAMNHKFDVKRYNMTLNRLRMLINMKLAGGSMFLKLILQRIEFSRKLFMAEIELGRVAFITKDIS